MSFVLVLAVTGTATPDQWPITVPDAGFDDHILNNVGDYIDIADAGYTGAWECHSGDAWIDYGYYANDPEGPDLPALSGNNKAYGYEDYIYQILDETFIEGETYTLSVWVGLAWSGYDDSWSLYFTGDDYTDELISIAGNGPVGEWGQANLVYTATAADAGKKIGIKMKGAEYITFEDVTLSYDYDPAIATNRTPAGDDVCRDPVLGWTPGKYADKHDVYFGTNFDDVKDATTTVDPNNVYKGRQDANSYTPPQRLDFGTTYYWRVDEVSAPPDNAIFKGEVWSFTTEPVGYPVAAANIMVTASSETVGFEAVNTINESGLDDAGKVHSTAMEDMWFSSGGPGDAVWLEYQFDKAYKLHQMLVWNHNSLLEPSNGFGVKNATVAYSVDGINWSTFDTEFARAPGEADYPANTIVAFDGAIAKYVKITAHSNWGGTARYGLSEVRFLYVPVWARGPDPAPGTTNLDVDDMTLSWRAGREAALHEVYLSTNRSAVTDGTALVETTSQTSYNMGEVPLGRTYYWKINEVNEAEIPTQWDGDLWSFATPEYLVVDDMESYGDANAPGEPGSRIWYAWKDGQGWTNPSVVQGNGTGASIGNWPPPIAERQTVHEGGQSMPYYYDNSGSTGKLYYSEAERTFDAPQDWTIAGVRALTLYFYGDPDNDAGATEQMYVKVNGAKVIYDGDMADIKQVGWHEWNIDLASFDGVNLQNVTKIRIGFGNENNTTTPGGSGVVYFDDIRLYPSRCVLWRRSADFARVDYVEDCVVDCKELELMTENWLGVVPIMVPITIDNPGFEDSVLADGEYDYSLDNQGWGYFANGGEQGSWNPGLPGTSEPGYGGNAPEGQNVGWANPGGVGVPGGLAQVLTDADATLQAGMTYMLTVEVGNTLGYPWGGYKVQLLAGGTPHTPGTGADYTGPVTGGTLLAEDNNSLTIREDTLETSTVTYTYDPELHSGLLREPLQIRLLSLGNVVAGDYTEADFDNVRLFRSSDPPSDPRVDLYEDKKIDFKDFAELAVWWLDAQLWP